MTTRTTTAQSDFKTTAIMAREVWGADVAREFFLAMAEAKATYGQVIETVSALMASFVRSGTVVVLTEWVLEFGVPSLEDVALIIEGTHGGRKAA